MKKTIIFLILSFIFVIFGFSQTEDYKKDFKKIYELTKKLDEYIDENTINFEIYDKWYKEFLPLRDEFVKKYINIYRKEDFFKASRDALDKFSIAWALLKEVDYAQAQYNEYISVNDIIYAHKWKETAKTKKKEAIDLIKEAKVLLEKIK